MEEQFNIIQWLLADTPPCEGGLNGHICQEDCWTDNCPYYQQYLEKAEVEA